MRKQTCKVRGVATLKCSVCGKVFERKLSQAVRAKTHYCSLDCKTKYKFCKNCGKRLVSIRDKQAARGITARTKPEQKGYCLQCWRDLFSLKVYKKTVKPGFKWCSKCRKQKLEDEFHPSAKSWCKSCENDKQNRLSVNPMCRLRKNISKQIHRALTDKKRGLSWELLVGYTVNDLRRSLENQFQPGMTWDNYGDWHIDHKIPHSAFNYISHEDIDFRKCWEISNLQPMWAKNNLIKGAKLEKPFQPSFAFG